MLAAERSQQSGAVGQNGEIITFHILAFKSQAQTYIDTRLVTPIETVAYSRRKLDSSTAACAQPQAHVAVGCVASELPIGAAGRI